MLVDEFEMVAGRDQETLIADDGDVTFAVEDLLKNLLADPLEVYLSHSS